MKKTTINDKNDIEAKFYMNWAMTSLERLNIDPYSNRGQDFYKVIRQLEILMNQIQNLDSDQLHQMQSFSFH